MLDVPTPVEVHPVREHIQNIVINLDPERNPTISIDETAIVLGIARSSAYEAARCGEIPTVRFGRRVRVPTAALRRMLVLDEHSDDSRRSK